MSTFTTAEIEFLRDQPSSGVSARDAVKVA
jgi:hypothetical protein